MKSEIRRKALKERAMLGEADWNEKSLRIQEKFLNEDFYRKAGVVLLYCHFDREVRTDLIIKDALERGKIVCVPFNRWDKNIFVPSRVSSLEEIDSTRKIPQPFVQAPFPADRIELAVIPGVLFDVRGNRVGMGKGFYDRFLKENGHNIIKVSFAFEFQVSQEELPVDLWDMKIDIIITEKRKIVCGALCEKQSNCSE